jgi:hypothetical protein
MSKCRSCNADVVFVPSATSGRSMILDAEPAKGIVLVDEAGGASLLVVDPRVEGAHARVLDVYTDHHVTCPAAPAWKGRTRANPPGQESLEVGG